LTLVGLSDVGADSFIDRHNRLKIPPSLEEEKKDDEQSEPEEAGRFWN
jgi:hypothetical protein